MNNVVSEVNLTHHLINNGRGGVRGNKAIDHSNLLLVHFDDQEQDLVVSKEPLADIKTIIEHRKDFVKMSMHEAILRIAVAAVVAALASKAPAVDCIGLLIFQHGRRGN